MVVSEKEFLKIEDADIQFYVYEHLKKTDGSVFYVGIGKVARAYNFSGRSKYWQNSKEKYGVSVNIVRRCKTWEEACEWEKFLIAFYGLSIYGGCLVNLTYGGDGSVGYKHSVDNIHKMKEEKVKRFAIPCDAYCFSSREFISTFDCIMDAARQFNIESSGISSCIRGKTKTFMGYVFVNKGSIVDWDYIAKNSGRHIASVRNSIPVAQYTMDGKFLQKYRSASEASRVTGISQTGISMAARGQCKQNKGFIWRYENI